MSAVDTIALGDIPSLLAQLRQERFYGRISFDLRAGDVVLIRTERTQLVTDRASNSHRRENRDGTESSRLH